MIYDYTILLFLFLFGAAIGSFLNCVIYRLEIGKSFISGRSFCPKCKKEIKAIDLVPILSFVLLKGKCRYCASKISFQYPLVELLVAIVFVVVFLYTDNMIDLIFLLPIFSLMALIFIYDLKHYLIPDQAILLASLLAISWHLVLEVEITMFILSAIGASAFFGLIYFISKGEWIGFGDVKLALFMGLFLGFPNILTALFLSFVIGSVVGIIAILLKKKKVKSEIPFAPFLITGTVLSFFYGSNILNWYFDLININAIF